MKNSWKTLTSKIVHKNPWYYVQEDKVIRPDGKKGSYNVVVKPPAVFIVAINEKQEVLLVKLYRYTTKVNSLEVPAGGVENEKPLAAAKRELKEETGFLAKKWKQLCKFQTANGILNHFSFVFLAQELKETNDHKKAEEGIDKTLKIPLKKALELIDSGKITDGPTIVALMVASRYLKI